MQSLYTKISSFGLFVNVVLFGSIKFHYFDGLLFFFFFFAIRSFRFVLFVIFLSFLLV